MRPVWADRSGRGLGGLLLLGFLTLPTRLLCFALGCSGSSFVASLLSTWALWATAWLRLLLDGVLHRRGRRRRQHRACCLRPRGTTAFLLSGSRSLGAFQAAREVPQRPHGTDQTFHLVSGHVPQGSGVPRGAQLRPQALPGTARRTPGVTRFRGCLVTLRAAHHLKLEPSWAARRLLAPPFPTNCSKN